jgi:hypothetical protein
MSPRWSALGAWVSGAGPAGHVAIDGKRLRGSATATSPGVHLLAAFSASLEGVIGQLRVDPATNEIVAALELLKIVPLDGTIITGDAIFTQKAICRTIVDGGGDYFFTVKGNQPRRDREPTDRNHRADRFAGAGTAWRGSGVSYLARACHSRKKDRRNCLRDHQPEP